ncbi:hypothetical protein MUP46_02410 [Patescibacteria group bacterium]|nr:hypothetical protein [Patescibacteria group bacterium]
MKSSIVNRQSSIVLLSVLCVLCGCTKQQLNQADRTAGDVNNLITAGQRLLATPAAAAIPPDWRLYGSLALAAGSIVVGAYKQMRLTLMTKTAKAIVKGIEKSKEEIQTNPKNPVLEAIGKEMRAAGIYDQANQLVDQLKIAR